MRALSIAIFLGLNLALSNIAASQDTNNPLLGPHNYPQFRKMSGFGGDGYGLTPEGYASLSGPIAYSIPTAYVVGHGVVNIEGNSLSYTLYPNLSYHHSSGEGSGTIGMSIGRFNVAGSIYVKSSRGDQVFNVQAGYVPNPQSKIAYSIGIQDIQGRGGSAGDGVPGDGDSSESIFGVATYRVDLRGTNPLYVTAGYGSRRYNGIISSLSYQVIKNLRVWGEQDQFGLSEGVALAWKLTQGRRSTIATVLLGLQDGRRFTLGAGVTF
jgi:hypothetical protein